MDPMRDLIYECTPASPQSDRWKDASPLGNGETGALVFGDVGCEHIRFTHARCWEGSYDPLPPDVSGCLARTRALMDKGRYPEADLLMRNEMEAAGYHPGLADPFPVCDMTAEFSYADDHFRAYRRSLHLNSGESEIRYRMGNNSVRREAFVSRADGCFYYRVTAETPIDAVFSVSLPDTDHKRNAEYRRTEENGVLTFVRNDQRFPCGAVLTVSETDGTVVCADGGISVTGFTAVTAVLRVFRDAPAELPRKISFDNAFSAHTALHRALYCRADIRLGGDRDADGGKSCETLLTEAFSDDASPELLEKLWRFGRYLFISGTAEGGLPFPLYGLWTGDYGLAWAQHVSNENVQIIYWHILTGALSDLMKPLISYFYEKLPQFRDNARQMFGCRGIVVSAYTTPDNGHMAPPVPVILHFTTASGWLCRQFFDYYDMTHDEETLSSMILPFALETAAFIEDYAVIRDGTLLWYPSVSPENTPAEYQNNQSPMGHPMPTTKNAAIELAIVKETLTRLTALCEARGLVPERAEVWKTLLAAIPPYAVNEKGAVREWQSKEFSDFYRHRHLSHIYPVFPGCEVTRENDPKLFSAFERAVDLRELGGQSGWSLAHMAGIYARLGRGNDVAECLDLLCRGCLLPNLFTLHNDWRSDHLTLVMEHPPVQLDALMGAVNAVQQMLLDWDGHTLRLFPALPDRLSAGSAEGLAFPGGTVSLAWDTEKERYSVTVYPVRSMKCRISLPENAGGRRYADCEFEENVPFRVL